MIYIRLITERWSVEGALIRFGTRSHFSHCEFIDDQNWTTLGSRLDGGVQIRPYSYCKPTSEVWLTAPDIEESYNEMVGLIGSKYDMRDIAAIAFNGNWTANGVYICSRAVAYANRLNWANRGGQLWFADTFPTEAITPRDFLVSPVIKFVRTIVGNAPLQVRR